MPDAGRSPPGGRSAAAAGARGPDVGSHGAIGPASHHIAHDSTWVAYDGFTDYAFERHPLKNTFLSDEEIFIQENQFADTLARACKIAGIEYGRIDFGFVGDSIQVHEINTDPTHSLAAMSENPEDQHERLKYLKSAEARLQNKILKLSTPSRKKIRIRDPLPPRPTLLAGSVRKVKSFLR